MPAGPAFATGLPPNAQADDESSMASHFGGRHDLIPLWIAEPYVGLCPEVRDVLTRRAELGWYGYETRPSELFDLFWSWMSGRHGWNDSGLHTLVSPSVGTSIALLIEHHSLPGDGVIIQPPVFTEFKPTVLAARRTVVRNPLALTADGYRIDLDGLDGAAADPSARVLILCNPHNPVGRAWASTELTAVAEICARHDVFVIADEIHADLILPGHGFTPFATAARETGVRWAATHGPIKTFGLAGVCDTLVVTDDRSTADACSATSDRLHLTRNNVFGLAAFDAAYRHGGRWLDSLLERVVTNRAVLDERLCGPVKLAPADATFLAWLDLRELGLEAPRLAEWLSARARLALSPGHWFGREGAGFARMTVAAPTTTIEAAAERLCSASDDLGAAP